MIPDGHTGPVARTSTPEAEHAAVVAYYRAIGPTLLVHLSGRAVTGFGAASAADPGDEPHPTGDAGPGASDPSAPAAGRRRGVALHLADATDLDEAVRSGVVGFRLPDWPGGDRFALHVRAGEESGIDVVATTGLALMELLWGVGAQVTAMLDGSGGMFLAGVGAAQRVATRTAGELAERSPEIATTSDADTAGRALVVPLPPGDGGLPAPYSLLSGPDGLAVVVPLTQDEVAAATAGMPLEMDLADVVERVRTRGDLALQLAGPPGADA